MTKSRNIDKLRRTENLQIGRNLTANLRSIQERTRNLMSRHRVSSGLRERPPAPQDIRLSIIRRLSDFFQDDIRGRRWLKKILVAAGIGAAALPAILGNPIPSAAIAIASLAGLAGAYGYTEHKTRKFYNEHYQPDTRLPPITNDEMEIVVNASNFMCSAYDSTHDLEGWTYEWLEDHVEYCAFVAFGQASDGGLGVVFCFRGTNDTVDILTDAHGIRAKQMTEWAGVRLPVAIDAAAGFGKRVEELGRNGLLDYVKALPGYKGGLNLTFADEENMGSGMQGGDDDMDKNDLYPSKDADEIRIKGNVVFPGSFVRNNRYGDFGEALDDCGRRISYVWIIGHSLGGACAEIFTAIFSELIRDDLAEKTRLIAFEPARGLRSSSIDALQSINAFKIICEQSIFITNGKDPVPMVPLPTDTEFGPLGFKHIGQNWHIPESELSEYSFGKPHSSAIVATKLLQFLNDGRYNQAIYKTSGFGKTKKKPKKKSSPAMKARMAYVRSFKKT